MNGRHEGMRRRRLFVCITPAPLPRYPAELEGRADRSSVSRRFVLPLGAWSTRHRTGEKLCRIPGSAGLISGAARTPPPDSGVRVTR